MKKLEIQRDLKRPEYYINRELSWIAFNERVLKETYNPQNPLFERLKFIAIASSNFDEFFMVRVAGLKDQMNAGVSTPDNKSGMSPKEQLAAISDRTHVVMQKLFDVIKNHLTPELEQVGILFLKAPQLNSEQQSFMDQYFHQHLYSVLTPMAVDASHPFPMLLNKSLNLAVLLDNSEEEEDGPLFAVVQVPSVVPRFLQLPSPEGEAHFILLEDVIQEHIDSLFQGYRILETSPFRITRNADLTIEEDETDDLLESIQQKLKKRKMGEPVLLEVDFCMSQFLAETLQDWLELQDWEVYRIDGPLDPSFFFKFYFLPGYGHLRFEEHAPQPPQDLLSAVDIFTAIKHKDILLHHPYESFDPVIHFIQQAADDPAVLAIKQTLYRVSGDSPIVKALLRAADNGKQVTVLLELKARFDEENNIVWAKTLEQAGCHVIYGIYGLKTHSKITLVVRAEDNGIQQYVHMSTGNYNDTTARFYTDLGLLTARKEFGIDAINFFNHLSGYSHPPAWKAITTAPNGLREKFLQLIENEIAYSLADKPARIIAKMNALTDQTIIEALYKASCAGVKIDLIIRGICCLRPGIEHVSENIRVISVIGRFLEHSRIYYFHNAGEEQIFLSSADWMTRNMIARVELLFPVIQENLKERVKNILDILLNDDVNARLLQSDGAYIYVKRENPIPVNSQMYFLELACLSAVQPDLDLSHRRLQPIFNHPKSMEL